ncbi:Digeranylgeranylglycerophospholipid reductase [Candidatus Gugararchaeum adminiculabundum]|nr:Digeranylgeranylglycerophospholipid reductase [Candidatus Gugararchaeum adminiculabundum]
MNGTKLNKPGDFVDMFDVIIVGAGPSGSSCAAMLGKKGRKVLLLEKAKYPRDKTCGDAISGKSMRAVKTLGLQAQLEASPQADVWGVKFSSPNGAIVEIPFPNKDKTRAPGFCCRREIFDNMLFQEAKKNARQTIEEFQVSEVIIEDGFAVGVKGTDLRSKRQMEFRAKLIIGADGANGVVPRALGVDTLPEGDKCMALRAYYKGVKGLGKNIELHFIDEILPGYFWIFPLDNGLANVGVGMIGSDIRKKKVDLRKAMLNAIERNEMFKQRFAGAQIVGEIKGWVLPFGSHHRKNYGNGFMLVGDAASLVDPFTGEGIGNATTSGIMAAKIADEALAARDFSETFLKRYDRELFEEIGPELKTSKMLQKMGRFKFLLNLIIGKASRNEEIRNTISGMLANEVAKKQIISPSFMLKVLFA